MIQMILVDSSNFTALQFNLTFFNSITECILPYKVTEEAKRRKITYEAK